ncbi:MAG: universal stress protein [Desulfovermiculus sp.]|nr:universal stress protein [Desulfovermiculus sp.]
MKFLVGYTGTVVAQAALALAREHALVFHAHVIVVTSLEGGSNESPEQIGQVEQDLREAEKFLKERGVSCETKQLVRGLTPGEDLVLYAKQQEVDHLYVGIRKKSRTQKIILGSTAQYIILKAPCPVTTVK